MTTDFRDGDGQRSAVRGLLFAGVALAMLLVSGAEAYAQETTTTTAPPATTQSTPAATDGSTGSAPASTSTATAPQDGSSGTPSSSDATASPTTSTEPTTTSTRVMGPAQSYRQRLEAKAAARKASKAAGAAGAAPGDTGAPANDAAAAAIQTDDGGGPLVPLAQTVTIGSDGTATANTGGNTVMGNNVQINGPVNQKVRLFGLFRGQVTITIVNGQAVTNNLNGTASATTGDANATGNAATTGATQTITPTNSSGGGGAATGQTVAVTNSGQAAANTGNNTVIGNDVSVNAPAVQIVRNHGPPGGRIGNITLINDQDVRTTLDGSARATTGDADAIGNTADTNVSQSQGGSGSGVGGAQSATVTNVGNASANTGNNTVIGNNVVINIPVNQVVRLFGIFRGDISISMVNNQSVVNNLTGSATLTTGDANATGNMATTSLSQGSGAGSGGGTQSATVTNIGDASANTGNNTVIGNNLIINMPVNQKVRLFGIFRGDITISLVNNQTIVNNLTGSASLVTGNATAIGNASNTSITQAAGSASGRDTDGTGHEMVKRVKKHRDGDRNAPRARARVRTSGEGRALPRTGGSLAVQALAGLLLVAFGGLARKSARTA